MRAYQLMPVRAHGRTGLADLGDQGKALVHCDLPAGAFVSPVAAGWLAGQPVTAGHQEQYRRCVTAWLGAGLIEPPSGPDAPPGPDRAGRVRKVLERAATIVVSGPVLAIAVSDECGFCRQLGADLAVNAGVLRRQGIAVVLAGQSPMLAGLAPTLAGLAPALAELGTPSALVHTPGASFRVVTGYDQVTAQLVALTGAGPDQVITEPPTSCSVNVTAAPADALLVARTGDGRLAGVAVRGPAARDAVAAALASGVAIPDGQTGYVPITMTVERPQGLFLLFRGGELVARSRTPDELGRALNQVLAGFTRPGSGQVALMCGVLVHRDGHAALFPRSWMSELVKRAARLDRVGWQIRPEPCAFLQPRSVAGGRETGGEPVLTWPAQAGAEPESVPVQEVWAEPLPGAPGRFDRGRLLAQVVNWIARPADAAGIDTAAAIVRQLSIRTGTWQQLLS